MLVRYAVSIVMFILLLLLSSYCILLFRDDEQKTSGKSVAFADAKPADEHMESKVNFLYL